MKSELDEVASEKPEIVKNLLHPYGLSSAPFDRTGRTAEMRHDT